MHTRRRYEPLFPLGRIGITPGALRALEEADERPSAYLLRHVQGDDGALHEDDKRQNRLAIRREMRVLSAYVLPTDERIWIITNGDRSETVIMLPEDY